MSSVIMKKEMTDQDIGNLHASLQTVATQANVLRSICREIAHEDLSTNAYAALAMAEKIGYIADRAVGFIHGDEGGDIVGGAEEWFSNLPKDVSVERRYEEND